MLVSKTLRDLLQTHIKQSGAVIWYDPAGAYDDFVHKLAPEDLAALRAAMNPPRAFASAPNVLNEENRAAYLCAAKPSGRSRPGMSEVAGVVLRPASTSRTGHVVSDHFPEGFRLQVFRQQGRELVTQVERDRFVIRTR